MHEKWANVKISTFGPAPEARLSGHAPLIFVTGAGAKSRNSIGIVLVAGMIVGTLFTLFVVPAFHSIIAAKHEAVDRGGGDLWQASCADTGLKRIFP